MNDKAHRLLAKRFRYYDAEACDVFLHPDNPEECERFVSKQGKFPAVLLRSSSWWYFDKERRPVSSKRNPDGQCSPMKAQAAKGMRLLLVDDGGAEELLVVEGEGHAFAARSVGIRGVVAAGGVKTLLSRRDGAPEHRAQTFRGKSVRVLFDADEAGRQSAGKAALEILKAGARRVTIVEIDFGGKGRDLEDWLADFTTREQACAALLEAMARAPWVSEPADLAETKREVVFAQSERVFVEGHEKPVLVVSTYDEKTREQKIAVFGPTEVGGEPAPEAVEEYPDQHRPIVSEEYEWRVLEAWVYGKKEYRTDTSPETLTMLANRTLVLPPPPVECEETSEGLWADIRAFLKRWVVLPEKLYDVLVGYVFMTYRLEDAYFPFVPYLRFYGPISTGKGRALDVMTALCWRSFVASPTTENLHRTAETFGDVTLMIDELHFSGPGANREGIAKLVDLLNLGYHRPKTALRMDKVNGRMIMRSHRLFGAKCTAGYGFDEHASLARRTVVVPMGGIPVPESMDLPALPEKFYEEAAELRGRLLAWRARKLGLGMPNPEGERWRVLRKAAGQKVSQVFWPLVEMVPASMEAELKAIIECAKERKDATTLAEEASEDSYLLDALVECIDAGLAHEVGTDRVPCLFVLTRDVHERSQARGPITQAKVAGELRRLGLPHGRHRVRDGVGSRPAARAGFRLAPSDGDLGELMERHGIKWPREVADSSDEAGL